MAYLDLGGTWRAQAADEGLRRALPDDRLDDSGWPEIEVPGHWRSAPAFAHHDGPLLYRRRFDAARAGESRRSWLVLDGLFYLGDVWLDGAYVGATEGYFFPHAFEVTEALQGRREHLLALEVTCSRPQDRAVKRNITGVFQHWDCLDPDWNPGGIWRPVRLEESGPVRITALRTLCREATDVRAVVDFAAVLDAATPATVTVRTTVGGTDHAAERPLAAGENRVEWTVTVEQPRLWWPHVLGSGELCDVTVDIVGEDGASSDRRELRTGLRQVSMRNWVAEVNGERLFLKGSNQGPTRMALGDAPPEDVRRDVQLAVDAGLDLLRVHAHVSRPELYDAADEAGLLLWQDFPLQWGYARGIRRQAVRQARKMVDLLGHHPSIALWCAHNEPVAIDPEAYGSFGQAMPRFLAAQELPSWNKTVLDRAVKRAINSTDGTRPVVQHSGMWPTAVSGGTDAHLYFGWYHGHERDLPGFLAAWPRFARFVSEFGAQAVPESAAFMEPDRWPDLDWTRLGRRHALQKELFDKRVPPAEFDSFEAWRAASQAYQSTVVKHHVETLRRLKYRPAGGFCHFCFADGHEAVTWSVLDHRRVPKAAYESLREACAPVIVVADRPAAAYQPGEALALDVHVVSDLREPLRGMQVTAALEWAGGEHRWAWEGDIGADECTRVGTVQAMAPRSPGPMSLTLELTHPDVKTSNRYDCRVV